MRCKYCFYIDETENRTDSCTGMMTDEVVHALVDKALDYAHGDYAFAFQGGEPTLAGLEFYRNFVSYVSNHPRAKQLRIHYSIQTNGYKLNEEWAEWFAHNNVLVGISLDGPKEIYDRYRVDHAGNDTFNCVMASIRLLDFFKKNNFRYQQYIECLDPIGETQGGHDYSLIPKKYETFQNFLEYVTPKLMEVLQILRMMAAKNQ